MAVAIRAFLNLFVGTVREIRSLYKNLETKTSVIPLHVDDPIFVEDRMYGIYVWDICWG